MQIYILTFSILLALSIFEISSKGKSTPINNLLIIFVSLWMIFIAGFRGTVFGDYCTYWNFFQVTPAYIDYFGRSIPVPDDVSTEWLYNFLFPMFIKSLSSNHVIYFTFVSTVAITINVLMFKKMSPIIFLSFLIYFSHVFLYKELQQVRSGLSSALILVSIYFLSESRIKSYFLTYIVASSIHFTAIFSIFAIFSKFMVSFFKQKKTIMIFIMLSVILLGANNVGLSFLNILENNFTLPWKYYVYKDTIGGAGGTNNYSLGIFSNITTIKYICFSLISIIYFNELDKSSKYFKYTFFFYYTGTLWIIFFNDFAIIATRIASMLTASEVILLPILIILFREKGFAFLLIVGFALLQLIFNTQYLNNVPKYTFIWNNVDRCQETFEHKMQGDSSHDLESRF